MIIDNIKLEEIALRIRDHNRIHSKEPGAVIISECLNFAAEIIEKLDRGEIQPAPQWISVKERLPEIGRSVLIYYPWWYGDEIQVAKLIDDGKMFDICGEISIMTGKHSVTHWMSLPKPPKE